MDIKRFLLGKALKNEQLSGERLSRLWGLPIMASDAVSSVAYAVEEILMALTPALGMMAVGYVGWIGLPIVLLLTILIFSYSQIINHYPAGGGAYMVSQENFGTRSSLLAAACLVIDYILTVAVSISSATAAMIAAFPGLDPYRVPIALACVGLITLVNLRGISESSKVFGIPTYAFIVSMAALIVVGLVKWLTGALHPLAYDPASISQSAAAEAATGMTLVLFLRAFSSGCSALTGVEAVSNAIPSFREPSQRTAKHVLYMLGILIAFIFGGTCLLATSLRVLPVAETTVLSQMSAAVFGKGAMYYVLQFTTSLVLLLAANTAYNGLPVLLSLLARDHFMPHQFTQRGTKLSFSNGILFILIASAILLIVFRADTHALIPFYAVGVFVSFTLSQAGMFVRWFRTKEKGWRHKSIINGLGALVTFVGSIVVFVTKFAHGAWALLIVVPLIMWFMAITHRHYAHFADDIRLRETPTPEMVREALRPPTVQASDSPCVVLMQGINRAMFKTLRYARDLSTDVTALHIAVNPEHAAEMERQWRELEVPVPLVVVPAPYREMIGPLEAYIAQREGRLAKAERLTVIMTKYVGQGGLGWRELLFHNQTTFFIERKLGQHKDVATVFVPYVYRT